MDKDLAFIYIYIYIYMYLSIYLYINWRVGSTRTRHVGMLEVFCGNLSVDLGGGYTGGYMCKVYGALHFTFGEGNGTPLQYSCLENPMGGRAW